MSGVWHPPAYAAAVLQRLLDAGFEAYFVGGCVRDYLLQRPIFDYDVCTSATVAQIKGLFSRTADTGIAHGTVTVVSPEGNVEVTTFRKDGAYCDCRHPEEVHFTDDLDEDLMRRDFTVNALCWNPIVGLVDRVGGQADLQRKVLRAIGNPVVRFSEDALRMVRAVRFQAVLGFSIEEGTAQALRDQRALVQHVSAERVRAEMDKILLSQRPEGIFGLLDDGLAPYLPAGLDMVLKTARKDAAALLRAREALLVRLGVLLFRQEQAAAKAFLTSMRYSNRQIRAVLSCLEAAPYCRTADRVGLKRLLHRFGPSAVEDALEVVEAFDAGACTEAKAQLASVLESGECYRLQDLAVSGKDLLSLGLHGRRVGEVLERLLTDVMESPTLNDRAELLQRAKKML